MDVLDIQRGWVGGKKHGAVPPEPPIQAGNHRGGATIYVVHEDPEELRKKRKLRREDEEILFLS